MLSWSSPVLCSEGGGVKDGGRMAYAGRSVEGLVATTASLLLIQQQAAAHHEPLLGVWTALRPKTSGKRRIIVRTV